MTIEPREPEQRTFDDELDEAEGLDVWMRTGPIESLLDEMSERTGERVRLILLDEGAVDFSYWTFPGCEPSVIVTPRRAVLLLAVCGDGRVDSFVAADDQDAADLLVAELEQRDDIGEAVRTLVRASEARPT